MLRLVINIKDLYMFYNRLKFGLFADLIVFHGFCLTSVTGSEVIKFSTADICVILSHSRYVCNFIT